MVNYDTDEDEVGDAQDPEERWLEEVYQVAHSYGLRTSDLLGIEQMYGTDLSPEDAVHAFTEDAGLSSGDGLYGDDFTG